MIKIQGVKSELAHEATIVILKGDDGKFYAQSSALCKADNPYTAVRRCLMCMSDYDYARRYDMYVNGEIDLSEQPSADPDAKLESLTRRCA